MAKRISTYSKIARNKELLIFMVRKFKPVCYMCGKIIDEESLPKGHELDKLTIHHVNEDREDNRVENLELVHRSCHRSYHRKNQERLKAIEK